MENIFEQFKKIGIIPVVVLDDASDAAPLAEALCEGGLPCAEVTFRTDAAADVIRIMTENYPELNQRIATVMKTQLEEIGIHCEIKPVDGALFSEYKYDKTSSDIIIAATGGAGDNVVPNYASNDYKTTSEVSGLTHIVNEEWMELQNKCLEGEFDNEYVDQCHYWIKDNVYGYALFHPALYCVTTPVVTGYTLMTNSYDCPQALKYI